MSYSILLDGFDTPEQAAEFVDWYSNSGEQDFSYSLDHSDNDIVAVNIDSAKTFPYQWNEDTLLAFVKVFRE